MSDPVRTDEPALVDEERESPPGPRLPGFAYPLLAVLFGGALVWSFSRILLAVPKKDEATAIALLMALNVLIAAALIAYGTRVRRRPAAFPFLLLAALLLVAGGGVAAGVFGDRGQEQAAEAKGPTQAVALEAKGIKFVQTELTFTEGAQIKMTFKNEDAGTQHNFALFNGPNASAPPIFQGDPTTGPASIVYAFTAPSKPGSYYFHCDFHPGTMTGTVKVVPGGGGGGGGAAPTEEAKGIKFLQPKLTVTPSGGKVAIHFVNGDAGTPHNIAVFRGANANAPVLFRGELVTGPGSADYTFTAPPPGTYFFHCDVHPTMTGTLTLSAPGG
jgi:plastocyanin